ncbi:MAG: DUF1987 domain-containing protein [Bacteroidia bacterium]|nr:DUF1987 domain-containing protein [Bacteroidia bacterium]MCX7651855.1 DUF1987 domain-containing protein [Bacteroidia bacterium]MDW8415995.1 SiaC family regulatory phosphoprotein [Bacteroidia bacterium]
MKLHIPASQYTPEVGADLDKCIIFLKGACFPENSSVFFQPLRSFVRQNSELLRDEMEVHIELSYINSSAQRELYELLWALIERVPQMQIVIYLGEEEEMDDLKYIVDALREAGFERIEYRHDYYSGLIVAEESPPSER